MNRVFKVEITRRLFWLFFGLAVIPTLLMTLLFSILRIRADQLEIQEAEQDVVTQLGDALLRLASSKADHYKQILDIREMHSVSLADFSSNHINLTNQGGSPTLMEDSFQNDLSIIRISIMTPGQTNLVYSFDSKPSPVIFPEIDPSAISKDQPTWMLRSSDEVELATLVVPIEQNNNSSAVFVVDYSLDHILNEVPDSYLAEKSVMFLISDDLQYIGIPSWARGAEYLLDYSGVEDTITDISLDPSQNLAQIQELSDLLVLVSDDQPVLEYTDLTERPCFIAISKVGTAGLNAVFLFPIEEVFKIADQYGASFQTEAPAILIQSALLMVGLLVFVGIGAMVTLRTLAEPIQELSKGADEVATGNLMYSVPVGGLGEITELGKSFNTMVSAIQTSQSALAESHMELSQTLNTQQKEFDIINQVSYQANLSVELPKKLTSTLEVIIRELGMSAGSIYLLNEVGGLFRASVVLDEQSRGEIITQNINSFEKSFAEQVSQNRKVMILDSSSDIDCQIEAFDPGKERCNLVGAPIEFHERMLGVMILAYHKISLSKPALKNFVGALSAHIAILIEVARLTNQTRFLAIAEERRRLARELHDSVTQTLFSLSMALDGALGEYKDFPPPVSERLQFVSEQALDARAQMRAMIDDLRPLDLRGKTLDEGIKAHVKRLRRSTDLQVESHITGDIAEIPTPIQYNLDRIVQEAFSNVIRHSKAKNVEISISISEESALLIIADNGIGFEKSSDGGNSSFGLISISERAEIMGGKVAIRSEPGKGTQVQVEIPLHKDMVE